MKSKGFSVLGMFALLLVAMSFASATGFTLSIVDDLPSTVDPSTTYNVKVNFDNANTTFPEVNISMTGTDLSGLVTDYSVAQSTNEDFDLTIDVPGSAFGTYSTTLTVQVNNGSDLLDTLTVDFTANAAEQSFCQILGYSDVGDLEITDFDINNDGSGDDDEWDILSQIDIDFAIENTNNDEDIDDVVVEILILDEDGDDVTDDFELDDEEIDLGDLSDDDEESGTFVIDEVPADIDEGDYRIYIAAYSEDDDTNCTSFGSDLDDFGSSEFYAEVEVEKEFDEGIIVDSDSLIRKEVMCGQQDVQVSLDLYNVGDDEEESVLVNVFNEDLDIDEIFVIDDFDEGKRKSVDLTVDIPNNLDRDLYSLFVVTYWDWDDDEDEEDLDAYDENSDDDFDETYALRLEILGNCDGSSNNNNNNNNNNNGGSSGSAPIINAELVSSSVVGEEIVVRTTVTNPSSQSVDYVVSVEGFSSWAELLSLQPGVVSLSPGESADVTIRFNPTESGIQTFTVKASNSDSEFSQDVSLDVASGSGSGFGFGSGNDSVMYWIAVALVILIIFLIVVIIVVAARR